MCSIKKVNYYDSYEEYEQNIPKNYQKALNEKNGIETFDTYEDYEQSVTDKNKKNHELFKIAKDISDSEKFSAYITENYKNDIDAQIEYYNTAFDSEEDRKNIYNYMIHIDNYQETKYMNYYEKIEYAKYLMKYDKANGYKILLSTPTLKSGKLDIILSKEKVQYNGNYLEYYNPSGIKVTAPLIEYKKDENGNIKEYAIKSELIDGYIKECNNYYNNIMQRTYNHFSDKFKNQILNNMQNIILVNANYNHDWAAFCTPVDNTNSSITIDMQEVMKDSTYMQSAYTHELGHVFSFASSSKNNFFINNMLNNSDIDVTDEWGKIYEQINKNDPNHNFLRDYAHKNQTECFAECVTEYYASPSDDVDFNPNDLKTIDIEVGGKEMTLYDYMDELLN